MAGDDLRSSRTRTRAAVIPFLEYIYMCVCVGVCIYTQEEHKSIDRSLRSAACVCGRQGITSDRLLLSACI
jgi:hypothetical protein